MTTCIMKKPSILMALRLYGELRGLNFKQIGIKILESCELEILLTNLVDFTSLQVHLGELVESGEVVEICEKWENRYYLTPWGKATLSNFLKSDVTK